MSGKNDEKIVNSRTSTKTMIQINEVLQVSKNQKSKQGYNNAKTRQKINKHKKALKSTVDRERNL